MMNKSLVVGMASLLLVQPIETKNVPHHNINVEQAVFSVVHHDEEEKGILSLNSKGLYYYGKKKDVRFDRYEDGKLLLPVKTRAEGRHWLGCGDFDGDGKEDLAYIINHMLFIHRNIASAPSPSFSPAPSFSWKLPFSRAVTEHAVVRDRENGAIADMNNDQLPDILINNSVGCFVFFNSGNFSFEATKAPVVEFPRHQTEYNLEFLAFDWNTDGELDIISGSSEGIFVAKNHGGTFSVPEKIASVKSSRFNGQDYETYLNSASAEKFPYVPQYTYNDTIILRRGVVDGKEVPVAGTMFGFFAIDQDNIKRLRLFDEQGIFLSRLSVTAGDSPDFVVKDEEIIYATKAGCFFCVKEGKTYHQAFIGRVEDGGPYDRAYLLLVNYDGLPQDYAVGTTKKIHFFTGD